MHEPRPGHLLVKIMDFGISKFSEDVGGGKTAQGVLMGTPEYMSPEQFEGRRRWTRSRISGPWVSSSIAIEDDTHGPDIRERVHLRRPSNCSGDMYSGVPMSTPWAVLPPPTSSENLEIPKSMIFTRR